MAGKIERAQQFQPSFERSKTNTIQKKYIVVEYSLIGQRLYMYSAVQIQLYK